MMLLRWTNLAVATLGGVLLVCAAFCAEIHAEEAVAAPWAAAEHWAFKRPVRPAEPRVKDTAWVRNPIDGFVLARLEKEGIRPSPEASRETLIRRVCLD